MSDSEKKLGKKRMEVKGQLYFIQIIFFVINKYLLFYTEDIENNLPGSGTEHYSILYFE